MKYNRTYNFSAGPAMMPEPVLEEIRDEMMNYRGSGMSVMEMSHRSKVFQQIVDEAEADLRDLMGIPDNYKVLFIQGGATLQFAAVPWNLMKNGKAVYVETGAWSKKAIAEAKKYGEVIVAASSKDKNYSYIPDCSDLDIPEDADYVYICENETIHGVTWQQLPNTKGHILVSDQSSMFLSQPCNVSDYGMIYAGVQKNVGPAGMVIAIIREDLIREDLDPKMPIYMRYDTHAKNDSMYNTPNCWAIYCCGKVFKYLKSIGGLEVMHQRNIEKAKVIYDFLDSSKMFHGTVEPEFRSLMNIPFVTDSAELDAEVVAARVHGRAHVLDVPLARWLKCGLKQVQAAESGMAVAGKIQYAVGAAIGEALIAWRVDLVAKVLECAVRVFQVDAPQVFSALSAWHVA